MKEKERFTRALIWKILLRLPHESLIRFNTVSKLWFQLISDPSFTHDHLHHNPQPHALFALTTDYVDVKNASVTLDLLNLHISSVEEEEKIIAEKPHCDHVTDTRTCFIPEAVIWKILLRLPCESLIRFNTVSKLWCQIISDPSFTHDHLHHNPQNHVLFVFTTNRFYISYYLLNLSIPSLEVEENIVAGKPHYDHITDPHLTVQVKAVCNGLLLQETIDYDCFIKDLYVYNPITRQSLKLPLSPIILEEGGCAYCSFPPTLEHLNLCGLYRTFPPTLEEYNYRHSSKCHSYGLMHDVTSVGQYKVVAISKYRCFVIKIELESPKHKNEWKELIRPKPQEFTTQAFQPIVSVNNELHWFVCFKAENKKYPYIQTLGANEEFGKIECPENGRTLYHPSSDPVLPGRLFEMEGVLHMSDKTDDIDKLDIWVLNDRAKSLWSKIHTISVISSPKNCLYLDYIRSISQVPGSKSEIFAIFHHQLCSYDMKTRKWKILFKPKQKRIWSAYANVNSIVSCV